MGELYNGIKNSSAKFIGAVETDGYTFDDSETVIDGKFIGPMTSMRTTRPTPASRPGSPPSPKNYNHRYKIHKVKVFV